VNLRNMKFMFMFKFVKRISMVDFRRDTARALAAVRRGEGFILTHRGRDVARLEPVRPEHADPAATDALLRVDDFAVDGPGKKLGNSEIDRILYGP
jgi:antitoxin (DNA-binding transcriptional repressor) of toxin-antitoxin stability system